MTHTDKQPQKDVKCVAGCKKYHGGEIKHHKDCPFYPESLSEYYDKRVCFTPAELEERDKEMKAEWKNELIYLFEDVSKTFKEIFPTSTAVEHLRKLQHEAKEAEEAPDDITEYADCLLGILGAASKSGISLNELIEASRQKLHVCKSRKWQLLPDGTYQHIKPPKQ